MSKFCTSCGAANSGSSFCTTCGATLGKGSSQPQQPSFEETPFATQNSLPSENDVLETAKKRMSKQRLFVTVVVAVLFVSAVGTGAFFVGRTSIDLEKEREISFKLGQDNGDKTGYDRGFSAGKYKGCTDVFDFNDGYFDHVVPYNPDNSFNRYPGSYYTSRSDC